MPPVLNPNVAQVDMLHSWDNQTVENSLYFFSTIAPDNSDLQELSDNLLLHWQTTMLPLMSSQVALIAVEATLLIPVPALVAVSPATLPNLGGDSNPATPNSTTIAISFRTGLSGRSYRGRNYWLGLTEPNVVNNSVSSTLLQDVADAYAGMIGANTIASNWTWGVYSRRVDNTNRETGLFTDITGVIITDDIVDSQRRRLPGRGR